MKEEDLFEDEQLVVQSDRNIVTLTDKRLRYSKSGKESSHFFSVLLENIGSIEFRFTSKPILWKLAVLFLLLGGGLSTYGFVEELEGAPVPGAAGGLLAFIFLVLYFATMKHLLHVHTKAGKEFSFGGKGVKKRDVVDFVNKVEKAMKERNDVVSRGG